MWNLKQWQIEAYYYIVQNWPMWNLENGKLKHIIILSGSDICETCKNGRLKYNYYVLKWPVWNLQRLRIKV